MQIPIEEFEQHIDDTILSRGLSYFRKGHVQEPEVLSKGKYMIVVQGTEDYTVKITIREGTVTEHVCNCPYDMGPVCKHVAAALFYLQQEELGIQKKTISGRRSPEEKRNTMAGRVDEILQKAAPDELKRFVSRKVAHDRTLRHEFMASFAHIGSTESRAGYKKQIRSILGSAKGRHGFIDWSRAQRVGMAVEQMLDTAERQMEAKNLQNAFYIITAVMEQMTKALQYADDSNGDIGGCIYHGYDLLYRLGQEDMDEPLRKEIIGYCFKAFEKEIYEGWDWHTGILEVAALLVKTEKEANHIVTLIDKAQRSEYERETLQHLKYKVLLKIKGEAEADKYLERHLTNPNLRREAIQKAIRLKDYDKAIQLAQEGEACDRKDKPGLAKEWIDWLLEIALQQGDTEKIIAYARHLLIDNFRKEHDYYAVLKQQVAPENWREFLEAVLAEIYTTYRWPDTHLIAGILIKEEWWDRLMEVVRKDPTLRTIETYEKHLSGEYAAELVDRYASAILDYLENNVGRKHYQIACRYLRRMIKLGGRDKVNGTITLLREKYRNRTALLEELERV